MSLSALVVRATGPVKPASLRGLVCPLCFNGHPHIEKNNLHYETFSLGTIELLKAKDNWKSTAEDSESRRLYPLYAL